MKEASNEVKESLKLMQRQRINMSDAYDLVDAERYIDYYSTGPHSIEAHKKKVKKGVIGFGKKISRDNAATLIQKCWRGFLGRRRAHWMRFQSADDRSNILRARVANDNKFMKSGGGNYYKEAYRGKLFC